MKRFFTQHREWLLVIATGMVVALALNVVMLFYHYDPWTNPKVGFWTAFWKRFEVSGFDPYTYIVISDWRPLYVLSRHPLLSYMMWPFAWLNEWLKDACGTNCAIHIVAMIWTAVSTASWTIMYALLRRIIRIGMGESLLLTAWFFSFSHVMLTIFVPDHMTLTLFLLLLALYLSGKALQRGKRMKLWQSMTLYVLATGVTTTNCIKIFICDMMTHLRRSRWKQAMGRTAAYAIASALIMAAYVYQTQTTQQEEQRHAASIVKKRAERDSTFRKTLEQKKATKRPEQTVDLPIAAFTEYRVDRLTSVTENIFGEGLILHERHTLEDANRKRPVVVRYVGKGNYVIEALVVLLFAVGLWFGRRQRLLWSAFLMFAFDMTLHVGLNFASADAYIMTAHWAFVIPLATAYLLKATSRSKWHTPLILLIALLTLYLWAHNAYLAVNHIL